MGRERSEAGSPSGAEDEQRPSEAEAEAGNLEEEDEAATEDTSEDSSEAGQAQDSADAAETFPKSVVDKLRRENADYRTKLKGIREQFGEPKTLAEERDTLRAENQELRTRVRRANFIEKVGTASPRLAWAALQDLSLDVEWDEKDQASNLPEVRKALKKEFPEDFGDRSVNGGDTGQAPAQNDMNAQIRAAAGR